MSTSMLTIRVRVQDATDAIRSVRPALQRLLSATRAALAEKERRDGTAPKFVPMRPRSSPRRSDGSWPTPKLRRAVFDRAEGRCENGDCDARIYWSSFDLDHFLGRGKAPQKPENCWALCRACHDKKHAGEPSRAWWLGMFLAFLNCHGFEASDTAREVAGQLQAERAGAELDAMRRERGARPDAIWEAQMREVAGG